MTRRPTPPGHGAPTTSTERLIERMLAELRSGMTTAGHLAIKITTEHRGVCPWNGESPLCVQRRELIAAGEAWLAARPRLVQAPLLEREEVAG